MSMGTSASFAASAFACSRSVTSSVSTRTLGCFATTSASASGISRRRCVAITVQPLAAYCLVNSSPSPEFAPVINTVSALTIAGPAASDSATIIRASGARVVLVRLMPALQTDAATVPRPLARRRLVRVAENWVRRRVSRAGLSALVLTPPYAQPNLPALRGEPVFAAHFVAAQLCFVLAVLAEVTIAVELGLELTRHELGDQRIVEEAQTGDLVRNHVLRDGEIADGRADATAIVVLERPFGVVE